jgi:CBS domain-containing protein
MATVKDLLAVKGTQVHLVEPTASVLDAAQLMNEHRIGSLVVMEAGRVCGIISERDILQRVVAECRDPSRTLVHEVMTQEVICCTQQMPIDEARTVLKERRIRHLPVIDEAGTLLGLISIGDLNAHMTNSQERHIHFLERYIYGQV